MFFPPSEVGVTGPCFFPPTDVGLQVHVFPPTEVGVTRSVMPMALEVMCSNYNVLYYFRLRNKKIEKRFIYLFTGFGQLTLSLVRVSTNQYFMTKYKIFKATNIKQVEEKFRFVETRNERVGR